MEAEYVNLDGVKGAGISSDQSGVDMIWGDGDEEDKGKGWSGGYYVGFTYTADFSVTFEFESESVAKATIIIRLGSELGDISLTPDIFSITLNNQPINYGTFYVMNSTGMEDMSFIDFMVTNSANINGGKNIITLKVLPNTLKNGVTGGPTIDCIKLESDAKLSYNPKTDNPSRRGGI